MKCRKCGYPLKKGDKFCSQCGAKVVRKPPTNAAADGGKAVEQEGRPTTEFKGYVPPEQDFDWHIHDFPGEPKPTADVNFNWNAFEEFHRDRDQKTSKERQGAAANAPGRTEAENTAAARRTDAAPDMTETENTAAAERADAAPDTTRRSAAEEPAAAASDQSDDLAAEEDDIVWSAPKQEPTPIHPIADTAGGKTDDRDSAEAEETLLRNLTDAGEKAEQDRESEEIDKFYTFNKKNEEFQRLLDREYEKIAAGLPGDEPQREEETEDSEERAADMLDPGLTEAIEKPADADAAFDKDAAAAPALETANAAAAKSEKAASPYATDSEAAAQRAAAPHVTDREAAAQKVPEQTGAAGESTAVSSESAASRPVGNEHTDAAAASGRGEAARSTAAPSAGEGGAGQKAQAPKPAERPPAAPPPKKRVWPAVVGIIAAVIVVFGLLAFLAPNSAVGSAIRSLPFFSASEEKAPAQTQEKSTAQEAEKTETDREEPPVDLSGAIHRSADADAKNVIARITYDDTLGYRKDRTYGSKDVENSRALTTNVFYKEDSGSVHYLDDAAVAAAIRHAADGVKKDGRLKSLRLGEIRRGRDCWYIWASVNGRKVVWKLKRSGDQLKVTRTYHIEKKNTEKNKDTQNSGSSSSGTGSSSSGSSAGDTSE